MVTLAHERLRVLLGLVAGPLGWVLQQQVLGGLEHFDCRSSGTLWAVAAGIAIGVLVVGAGAVAWHARRRTQAVSRFLASLGVLSAAVFLFAIGLQTLASVIVPACAP